MLHTLRLLILMAGLIGGRSALAADQKLTVMLDWFINPDHAPLIVAQEKGLFAAQGLAVELISPRPILTIPRSWWLPAKRISP